MTIFVIAILLEGCPACENFKKIYWNNYDENWQILILNEKMIPVTYIIPSKIKSIEEHNIYKNYLEEKGINYINSYPFIFASQDGNYNVENIIVLCADYNKQFKKFIYREGQTPACRNRSHFIEWLQEVKNNFN